MVEAEVVANEGMDCGVARKAAGRTEEIWMSMPTLY